MKNEKDVKAKVKKLLDQYKWFWFMPPANAYGRSGIADILALKAGVFLAIETKFGSNKPTALQIGFLNSITAESGYGFVVNDQNLPWLETFLKSFDRAVTDVAGEKKMAHADGAMLLDSIRALQALI